MNNDELFSVKSDHYAAIRPQYPEELFTFIKEHASVFNKAWDCATGNGQAAVGLAKMFSSVEASDISENQIANAFYRDNIRYSVQHAEKTSFADNSFDVICVAQALHWFHFEKFWPEIKRLLKEDGLFIAFSYAWSSVNEDVDSVIDTQWRPAIEPYWAENNKLCWNGYASIPVPFERLSAPKMKLTQSWTRAEYLSYLGSWSASRLFIEDNGDLKFNALAGLLKNVWPNETEKKTVIMPLSVLAGYRW